MLVQFPDIPCDTTSCGTGICTDTSTGHTCNCTGTGFTGLTCNKGKNSITDLVFENREHIVLFFYCFFHVRNINN